MTKIPPPPQMTVISKDEPDPLLERREELKPFLSQDVISSIVLNGDLSKLSTQDLTSYYVYRCRQLGLDPATKPFDILTLQGKKILYANKACSAQLRALNKISTGIIEEKEWSGLLIVKVRAWYPDGRQNEDEGFARIEGLGGDALGNARLKAMTKATRRAILGLCGLGELDETEVDSIPGAKRGASAIEEAKALLVPKVPATGSDVIQIADVKPHGTMDNFIEVLDNENRVWNFTGEAASVAVIENVGKSVMVEYTVANNVYTVYKAQV